MKIVDILIAGLCFWAVGFGIAISPHYYNFEKAQTFDLASSNHDFYDEAQFNFRFTIYIHSYTPLIVNDPLFFVSNMPYYTIPYHADLRLRRIAQPLLQAQLYLVRKWLAI